QKAPPGQIALAFHEVYNFKLTEALAKVVTPVKTGVQECLNLVRPGESAGGMIGVTGFRLEFIRRRRAGMTTIRS
ncbi:MAG: hypothetical protein Q8O04_07370, partial [Deltaproteobacteria bacterium]|nr:hypothetical protein [Deltaproteobacteria bacterium]